MEQQGDGEGVGEEEGAVEGRGQESAAREGEKGRDSREGLGDDREGGGSKRRREEDEQQPPERQQRGEDEDWRPKRKRVRGVRYAEEPIGHGEEPGPVGEGVTVYGPHKVRGTWRMYEGTVEEMNEQQECTWHVTKAAIVRWEDQGVEDEEGLPYPVERLRVCPQGRQMEIQGQLVQEQEARELEGEEMSAGRKNKKRK